MSSHVTLRVNAPLSPQQEWEAAFTSFTTRCEGANLSPGTVRFYKNKLAVFARYADAERLTLASVTAQHLRAFFTKEVKRTSPMNAKHVYRVLSTFFNHLTADGWLSSSPLAGVDAPKAPHKLILSLTQPQIQSLLDTCGRDFSGLRDRAIILLLVDSGVRAKELLGLTFADCDVERGRAVVMGKGAREREVYFGEVTRAALKAYLVRRGQGDAADPLFINCYGTGLAYRSLAGLLQRRGTKAELPPGLCHPHAFRHTAALFYLRNGGDAFSLRRLLGHSSLWMTEQYVELSKEDVADKHKLYSPGDCFQQNVKPSGRSRMK